ncbi:oxygenase MpaB family protein [Nocardioides jensenii]|uniref:oxygenase MpaB family protein n=1 Tax=Nocardioides jensenii TaxID=1843 RepID=UPI000830E15F|nr:oxygenase MpaB family protein [Nocardioides jensenii]
MAAIPGHGELPTTVRHHDEALRRFGDRASAYFSGMWDGDPLADAFVADFATIGHGRGMRMLRQACREGVDAVEGAPASLRALFAQLDAVPAWVDLARINRDSRQLARYTRQAGIVLGAASLVSGYANSAASRPLELTGRYVENAGMRTIEVGSWLLAINADHGLERDRPGFELTVRVRIIHALVRRQLLDSPDWDTDAWGVPICQSYLAYTLIEFCLIPLRGMRAIGAPYLPHEVDAYYETWRYVGHLLGIDPSLLPTDEAEQRVLEELYLLTRPPVDDYCISLVAAINDEFLVPEIEELLPRQLYGVAPPVVHGLERIFLGEKIADELQVPTTRATPFIRLLGSLMLVVNLLIDRIPGSLTLRTRLGERYRDQQETRLRTRYSVRHDLVDDSPAGGKPHPARDPG